MIVSSWDGSPGRGVHEARARVWIRSLLQRLPDRVSVTRVVSTSDYRLVDRPLTATDLSGALVPAWRPLHTLGHRCQGTTQHMFSHSWVSEVSMSLWIRLCNRTYIHARMHVPRMGDVAQC